MGIYAPYYTIMQLLHWTGESTQKNHQKKNQNKITLIYALYYTIMQLLHWTGESTQKNQPKKIKIKSPLSMPLTTQLCNFYIELENQPKKINKKNQNKITFIYAPYYTIMQLLNWTGESTQKNQPKRIKLKSPLSMRLYYT